MRFTFHVDANIDDPDDAAMFARLVGDYLLGLDDVTHVTGGGTLISLDGTSGPVITVPPPCDVVEGCRNVTVDCVGGEVYHCAEHESLAGDVYWEWQKSPERALRVAERAAATERAVLLGNVLTLKEREQRAHAMIRGADPARFVHDLTYSALVSELREHLAGPMHHAVTDAPLGEMVAMHAEYHANARRVGQVTHVQNWWRLLATEDEDLLGHGRCDSCGAPCGPDGCLTDPAHEASIPG